MLSTLKRRIAALAVLTVAGTAWAAPQASAATLPTPSNPGGIAAPSSPNGIPSNGVGPLLHTWPAALVGAHAKPGQSPTGANDFSCKPRPGENPVVLVPGTNEDAYATWAYYSPMLSEAGWCVFTFNYNPAISPFGTVDEATSFAGDIRSSAAFLAGFVDRVRAATGSAKVDLIGHSQGGGPLPRSYLKYYGGAAKVDKLIGLVPSNQGTTALGLQHIVEQTNTRLNGGLLDYATKHNMLAMPEQLQGSAYLTELNQGGMTQPGPKYTVIASQLDDVVTPYTNAYIPEPGVTNLTIQDLCPADLTDHFGAAYDPVAFQVARNALNPERAQAVNCVFVPPVIQ